MAKITNTSTTRAIALHVQSLGKFVEIGRGATVDIDDKDWSALKKLPTVAGHIKAGELVEAEADAEKAPAKAKKTDEKKD